ncbi:Spo0E family sporulation regulatory protein-aspartic acid phosphatase [Heyndrickxia acidicola]|uniref:Aspartyl-phosphate phosphatase Spo0E family protein n=1 Tax=Heyndrickxia acidicola TaxID=209389 RepID=A0ABU6MM99_9BACI|nr:aspartyl-phosphate phosphatase Spo0E family protein [Heyndrickxia acidicola]MED1205810.1 aspartyl-phosphate phosphatase Spo0E family protein [Heyndrickxia acidicola]
MNNDLFEQIEMLRRKMISVGMSNGFTSKETIILSEKLDYLINLQLRLQGKMSA